MRPSTDQTTSKYLFDERARWLGRSVDHAYWEFVNDLPDSLQRIAALRGTFDHRSVDSRAQGLLERNAINTGPLFLFWGLCDGIDDQTLLTVAEASAFIGLAYILLDHLVDDQTEDPGATTLLQLAFHDQGLRKLRHLLPNEHPFWNEYDRLSAKLRSSLALELACRSDPRLYSEDNFRFSAEGKVSPAVITITAASMLRQDIDNFTPIEEALNNLICAGQLAHDVEEWREDLSSRDLTYFLSNCAAADRWTATEWPGEEEIEEEVNNSKLEIKYIELARDWFMEAKEISKKIRTVNGNELEFANWNAYMHHYIDQANRFAVRARRRHVMRVIFGS